MRFYAGDRYLDAATATATCRAIAEALPGWASLEEIGRSREGRPIVLLTLGRQDEGLPDRPALWLDGGTHAAEWAGVMAAVFAAARWAEALAAGDARATRWFSEASVHILPCMSPDGHDALLAGAPFLRSTLRPPPDGLPRVGLDPQDIDGDGHVRWMRWRHPAGTHVPDEALPQLMRRRRLGDDPDRAYFYASEGLFLNWDGVRWVQAPRAFGLDLNRNFPASWAPFSMFGMDGGLHPLSEPESRAAVDAFTARPHIAAGLTLHTYTGALLTQPYRDPSPLSEPDVQLMESLARAAVRDTPYRVFRVHPEFTYDPKQPVVGVWADAMSCTFGVPGYTLELWDPFAMAGQQVADPAGFFRRPDEDVLREVLRAAAAEPDGWSPWRRVTHPQLGEVEVGGIDYMRTVRNPPERLLATECARALAVADVLREALPRVEARLRVVERRGGLTGLELVLENLGFLPTSGLARGAEIGASPGVSATLIPGEGLRVHGAEAAPLPHLDGWGSAISGLGANPLYPSLPARGHRAAHRWWVEGQGEVLVAWRGGRAGGGCVRMDIL